MTMTGIHPVSSKEHMLEPTDIFIVAAHEYKEGLAECAKAAKKHGVSPERLSYSIMLKAYSDPRLIRIRAGNTLFTIAALPDRVGFVHGYNGDTGQNYVDNILEFSQAARKIGFDLLICSTTPVVVRALKLMLKKQNVEGIKSNFDSSKNLFSFTTGEPRGE